MLNAADMMELADMMSRYCHLSEGFLFPTRRVYFLVKAGSSWFYNCGSSVMLRLGSSPCKNRGQ